METYLGYFYYTFTNYKEDKQYRLIRADSKGEALAIFVEWLKGFGGGVLAENLTYHVEETIT